MHAVIALVVALFGVAGFWQLDRLSERHERNEVVLRQRNKPVAPISDLFDSPDQALNRRVQATGRFDTGRELILSGRPNEGRPGNHVLTPLVLFGGRAVIVDRGWVPTELDSRPVVDALPPGGRVEVTGIVLPSEGSGPLAGGSRKADVGVAVSRIDVARIARTLPYRTFPSYVVLVAEMPPQSGDLPDPVTLAELGEGPHLAYAIQWFLFIPIALVGYGAILRREAAKKTTAGVEPT